MIDGDVKLSQSIAITKYLARKHGLVGLNVGENIRINMLEGEVIDLRWQWGVLCYLSDYVSESIYFVFLIIIFLKVE